MLRKRLTRLAITISFIAIVGIFLYQRFGINEEITNKVRLSLQKKFPNCDIEVGSASFRLFGGIRINHVVITPRSSANREPLIDIPTAIIWPDKEALSRGKLAAWKIEFHQPKIVARRNSAGTWNLLEEFNPANDDEIVPILVLKDATIVVGDDARSATELVTLNEVQLTVINDPQDLFSVELTANSDITGPFQVQAKYRTVGEAIVDISVENLPLHGGVRRLMATLAPDAHEQMQGIRGNVQLNGRLTWRQGHQPTWAYSFDLKLRDASAQHPELPVKFSQLELDANITPETIRVTRFVGQADGTELRAHLEMGNPLHQPEMDFSQIPNLLQHVEVSLVNLELNQALFDRLPPKYKEIQDMFAPKGKADIIVERTFTKEEPKTRITFQPRGMSAMYRGFRYPVDQIRGNIVLTVQENRPNQFELDLVGEGKQKPVTLKGTIVSGLDGSVDLVLTGSDILLDDTLIDALPDHYPTVIRSLQPEAVGDFTARIRHNESIRQKHGPDAFDNEFDITIKKGSLNYQRFRYPLTELAGKLVIRTAQDEPTAVQPIAPGQPVQPFRGEIGSLQIKDFTARGTGGAFLKISGSRTPEDLGAVFRLNISGESVPLDGSLHKAIGDIKLNSAWDSFDPTGRMNCEIRIVLHDRVDEQLKAAEFIPARDLELGLSFNGITIRPVFWPYALNQVTGRLKYADGTVTMGEISGSHQRTSLKVASATIQLPLRGGYYADIRDVRAEHLTIDDDFLHSLPRGIQDTCKSLELNGDFQLHAKQLVVSNYPPEAEGANPMLVGDQAPEEDHLSIYWNGTAQFTNTRFNTGVPWTGVRGRISSWGLFKNNQLDRVVSDLAIDQAAVLKQPVSQLTAAMKIYPQKPDILAIETIRAQIYGGEIGGEARIRMGSPMLFSLSLDGAKLKLEEFAKINHLGPKTQLAGDATLQLRLANPIDPQSRMPVIQGSGAVDIPKGKILDLPFMLDIIKLVRLRPMDHTMFEEAHAVFRIRGNRVRFGQLDLLGNAVSLGGEGEMNLDGTDLDLEFYTVWTDLRNLFGVSGNLSSRLSSLLYKIKVKGELKEGKIRTEQEALPALTDPVRRLFQYVRPNP
ncbi:MAG: AsmA-like C-terminal region-containing protein [Zavarzinella sp.]